MDEVEAVSAWKKLGIDPSDPLRYCKLRDVLTQRILDVTLAACPVDLPDHLPTVRHWLTEAMRLRDMSLQLIIAKFPTELAGLGCRAIAAMQEG